jgi:hypothetical protein
MKKTKTFAEKAKHIVNRYKRADWDPIEKAALESSLQKLQEEQEMFKNINGIGENQVENETTTLPEFKGFGTSYINMPNQDTSYYSTPDDYEAYTANQSDNPAIETTPYTTSNIPSYIGGGVELLGNLGLALGANKASKESQYSPIRSEEVSPNLISLQKSRNALEREATRGSQRIKYGAAQGSRSRGEYMANRTMGEAELASRFGDLIDKTYEKESLANTDIKNRAISENASNRLRTKMFNKQLEDRSKMLSLQKKADRDAYIAAAIKTIPQTAKDVLASKQNDKYIQSLGKDYEWRTYKDEKGNKKHGKFYFNPETGEYSLRK